MPERTFSGKYILGCVVFFIVALVVLEGQNICKNNINQNKHRNYLIVRKFRGKKFSRIKPICEMFKIYGNLFSRIGSINFFFQELTFTASGQK